MRAPASTFSVFLLVLSGFFAVAGQQLPADEQRPPAGYSGLYTRISRAVVGITRSDYPRERARSSITHYGTGTLLDPVGLVLTTPTVVPEGSRNIDIYLHGGRVAAAMPAAQGVLHWPPEAKGLTLLADEAELPFEDLSNDRVLVIDDFLATHGGEPQA